MTLAGMVRKQGRADGHRAGITMPISFASNAL